MSEHFRGVCVAFKKDIGEEAIARVMDAIRLMGCVQSVKAMPADPNAWISKSRVEADYRNRLMAVLWPDEYGTKK